MNNKWKNFLSRISYNNTKSGQITNIEFCFRVLILFFVMRNGGETRSMSECAITVDELEALLGLDLFCNLPDELEESVESKMVMEDWIIR